jgi:hypothetical protein
MSFMGWLKGWWPKGLWIGYSTGKPFDPTDQSRTDPIEDIDKTKENKK